MKSFDEESILQALPAILHRPFRFVLHYIRRCIDEGISETSAALAFELMLSLVPLVTVSLYILSFFPDSLFWAAAFERFLEANLLPEKAATVIAAYTLQFSQNAVKLTHAGLVMLALTSLLMLHTMETVLNHFWKAKKPRRWPRRLLLYTILIVSSPLIIGGMFVGIHNLLGLLLGWFDRPDWLAQILYPAAEFILIVFLIAFLYIALPNTAVHFFPALTGSVFAASGIVLARYLFSLYLTHFPSYSLLYGVFAVFPIFLLWLYLSWAIVLAGALLSAIIQCDSG